MVQKALEDKKKWFAKVFESVVPWDDIFVVEDKIVWIRCKGIPLKFWSKHCFEQVAPLVGSLIEVDVATLELLGLIVPKFKRGGELTF